MTDRFVRRNRFNITTFFQFTIMVLTVTAVLDVVQVVARFFAE